jgi:hypothetical protein
MEQIGFIIKIMQERKPNFIDKLRIDWKGHIILGLIINPVIFIIMMLLFNWLFNSSIWGVRLSIIPCAVCHWIIELSQEKKRNRKKGN